VFPLIAMNGAQTFLCGAGEDARTTAGKDAGATTRMPALLTTTGKGARRYARQPARMPALLMTAGKDAGAH